MKPARNPRLDLALALLWFGGGYVAMWGLSNILPFLAPYILEVAFANTIIGLVALILVTRTEAGAQLFYQGPKEGEEDRGGIAIIIGLLWTIPLVFFIVGLFWWILGYFIRWLR